MKTDDTGNGRENVNIPILFSLYILTFGFI